MHTNLNNSGHCPKEIKWEDLSTQSGFARSTEGIILRTPPTRGNKRYGMLHPQKRSERALESVSRLTGKGISLPKSVKTGEDDCFFKCKYSNTRQRNTKNQGNMTIPKEQNNFLVTNPEEMEIYKLPDKEFKIIVLR